MLAERHAPAIIYPMKTTKPHPNHTATHLAEVDLLKVQNIQIQLQALSLAITDLDREFQALSLDIGNRYSKADERIQVQGDGSIVRTKKDPA